MARVVVAIDAGTTGVRALAVDEQARVADVAYRELTQYFPRPGWVEHDPAEIWEAVRATLAEVGGRLDESGDTVAAIGITNQRETLVAFDRSTGRPLHRAIVWQDRRTAQLCAALTEAGHLPLVRATTGLVLDPYFSATKAAWLLASGDLALTPDSPDLSFCTVDTWVLWNLTGGTRGGTYATDPSNASRTLLLDTATLSWSPELCALFGVPPHTLAEVRPSAGRFGAAALGDLGPASAVLDGVPVSGVLGDQQAALFGQTCFEPGMVKVTYGTGSFALANAGPDRPPAPDGLTVSCAWDLGDHADDAGHRVAYALEGSAFVSGAAIQWLRDGLGIISTAAEVGPLAASVPDSGGVTFVPALTGLGSPWWDPAARGIVTGLTRGAGRAQLARACVEGDGLPGARHDRCHGRRVVLPTLRAAGRRGRRRHGPPPRAAGRAEPHAGGATEVARDDRARCGHRRRPGRGSVVVARRTGRAVAARANVRTTAAGQSSPTPPMPSGAAWSRSRWAGPTSTRVREATAPAPNFHVARTKSASRRRIAPTATPVQRTE